MKFFQKKFSILLLFFLLLSGCAQPSSHDVNTSFTQFTNALFRQEVASNTISLHYTLEHPESYNLTTLPVSYGTISSDITDVQTSIENYCATLHTFPINQLTPPNQLTYKILDYYLETASLGSDYLLYQEPLSPTLGIQSQLPVLLAEFAFHDAKDVESYLQLLSTTEQYFQSIIDFELQKSQAGLFMSDHQLNDILSGCHAFLDMQENNYLFTSFEARINALDSLSASEKEAYIAANADALKTKVFPAYTLLIDGLSALAGTGNTPNGLCCLPQGTNYYEYLVRQTVGISDSIPTLQKRTKTQILEDLSALEKLLFPTSAKEASILDTLTPLSLLNDLKQKTEKSFPAISPVKTTVKYVPADMQDYLSPAFYMIPAIDNYQENVIYINQGQILDALSLYTTLAHEGYPGHLYQTVYFHASNPDPIRSILDFGGYVEGWATYAEMMSYYMAPLSDTEATFMQKNNSLILGLYAYADMGIHYDGWTLHDLSAFFSTYGISDPQVLENIYYTIIGTPANYLKYYIGYLEFYDLKKEIAGELQKEFSQKDFHQAVLDVGPAPFNIVKEYVRQTLLPES